jgi:hypothetical protein
MYQLDVKNALCKALGVERAVEGLKVGKEGSFTA